MLHTLVLLAMAVAAAVAQGVTAPIAPSGSYPDGCAKAFDGTMWISVLSVNAVQKRGVIQEVSRPSCAVERRRETPGS